jgi:tetratricopeptide (TPR) repeat protein
MGISIAPRRVQKGGGMRLWSTVVLWLCVGCAPVPRPAGPDSNDAPPARVDPSPAPVDAAEQQRIQRLLTDVLLEAELPGDLVSVAFTDDAGVIARVGGRRLRVRAACTRTLDDDELAFTIAHEVAHLTAADAAKPDLHTDFARESDADDQGVLWALTAGFRVEAAVSRFDKYEACLAPATDALMKPRRDRAVRLGANAARDARRWKFALLTLRYGDPWAAQSILEEFVKTHPSSYQAWVNLGVAYVEQHLATLTKSKGAIITQHDFARSLYVEPATALMGATPAGLLDRARDALLRAVKLRPESGASALLNLGVVEDEAGNLDKAAEYYQKVAALLQAQAGGALCHLFPKTPTWYRNLVSPLYNDWGVLLWERSQAPTAKAGELRSQALDCFQEAYSERLGVDGEDAEFAAARLNAALVLLTRGAADDKNAARVALEGVRERYRDSPMAGLAWTLLDRMKMKPQQATDREKPMIDDETARVQLRAYFDVASATRDDLGDYQLISLDAHATVLVDRKTQPIVDYLWIDGDRVRQLADELSRLASPATTKPPRPARPPALEPLTECIAEPTRESFVDCMQKKRGYPPPRTENIGASKGYRWKRIEAVFPPSGRPSIFLDTRHQGHRPANPQ